MGGDEADHWAIASSLKFRAARKLQLTEDLVARNNVFSKAYPANASCCMKLNALRVIYG